MEREFRQKVEQLYHSVLKVEASRRASFLEQACAGDEVLKQEVRSLLAQAPTGDCFLEVPAMEMAATVLASTATATAAAGFGPGETAIGRYHLLRPLGEGGMGMVYEAEQDHPRRIVALKVIKPGFATAQNLRRFQYEAQALGRLQHAGIAQIYEAGTADTGLGPQPYFAMELIHGLPLHKYAEAHQINVRERLALMANICDAVDHAHQRGVIHRDLKPGNILVDETGQPKVLDFGVARVTEGDAQLTRQTDVGQLVGTLAYMSPEQVLGDPDALDNRSDVYTLGVILYELLAGKLPYDIKRKPLHEAVGVIREKEPTPLSSVHRSYRGDIDTIVAKALEKDKARRYASAAELAVDIRRYLSDQPITARPPSASYQLQKFVRRHRALVAAAASVFLALAAGVVVSTREAVRARTAERAAIEQRDRVALAEARAQRERNAALAEKQRADAEAATAQAVSDFLQNDLLAQASASSQSGPNIQPDPDLKVRTALDRAAARIKGKFDGQPEVEAAIRDTMGQTYMDLGLYPEARKQLERALVLHRQSLGAESPKTLRSAGRLGFTAYLEGKYAEAGKLLSQTLKDQCRVLGLHHPDTLASMSSLADLYKDTGKYVQAEALESQALEIRRRVLGSEHPDTLTSMHNLANLYNWQGKYKQAEAVEAKIVEIRRRLLGSEHPDTLASMANLAFAYEAQGNYAHAETLYRQTLEIERRVLGPEHPVTLYTLLDFAALYQRQGKNALAEAPAAQAFEGQRHTRGPEHLLTLDSEVVLALCYLWQGKSAESERLARQVLEIDLKVRPDHWQRFGAEALVGASLAGQKRYAEAEPLLVEGYKGMLARKDRMGVAYSYYLDLARGVITQFYRAWGKPEKAAEWRQQ